MKLNNLIKDFELLNTITPKLKDVPILDDAFNTNNILFTHDGLNYVGIKTDWDFNIAVNCLECLEGLKKLKLNMAKKEHTDIDVEFDEDKSVLVVFDKDSDLEVELAVNPEEKYVGLFAPDIKNNMDKAFTLNNEFIDALKYHCKFTLAKSVHEVFNGMHCMYNEESDSHHLVTTNNLVFVYQEFLFNTDRSFVLPHIFLKCLKKIKKPGQFLFTPCECVFTAEKYSIYSHQKMQMEDQHEKFYKIINFINKTKYTRKTKTVKEDDPLHKLNFNPKVVADILKLSYKIGFSKWDNKLALVGKIPYGFIAVLED